MCGDWNIEKERFGVNPMIWLIGFLVFNIVLLPVRGFQLWDYIINNRLNSPILSPVLVIFSIAALVFFMSPVFIKSIPTPKSLRVKSHKAQLFTLIPLVLLFFATSVLSLMNKFVPISSLSKLFVVVFLFGFLAGGYLIVLALELVTQKNYHKNTFVSLLALSPSIWLMLRLIYTFMESTTNIMVHLHSFDLLAVCFCMIFFLQLAKIRSGKASKKDHRNFFFYGFLAALFLNLSLITYLIHALPSVAAIHSLNMLYDLPSIAAIDFFLLVYILISLGTCFPVFLRKKS